MSRQEGKVVRPLKYCLDRSRLALEDRLIPGLRQEIIHGELSPDKAWREARRYLQKLRATVDLSEKDEALARSYWWLAKTRRDYPEEFKTEKEEKEMGEKNILESQGVLLPRDSIIMFPSQTHAIRLCEALLRGIFLNGKDMDWVITTSSYRSSPETLRDLMIQILKEKFGYVCIPLKEVEEKKAKVIKLPERKVQIIKRVGKVDAGVSRGGPEPAPPMP